MGLDGAVALSHNAGAGRCARRCVLPCACPLFRAAPARSVLGFHALEFLFWSCHFLPFFLMQRRLDFTKNPLLFVFQCLVLLCKRYYLLCVQFLICFPSVHGSLCRFGEGQSSLAYGVHNVVPDTSTAPSPERHKIPTPKTAPILPVSQLPKLLLHKQNKQRICHCGRYSR